ncbi:sulfur oxidation c-type cytochrome SoxX [Oceanicella actignis]|uniref:sulfur oxidation c-type cytochrome SoxX n=1 Tax=Oceanicella actignis TaxID=1189325 RepID=UPI0011E85493|nr:sulfur oxidation c-type cytochrome SoxX [Oceanicella actignis]TYO91593.1 sulfur-oxidizing protein SoxX [Oceanicella actignis]
MAAPRILTAAALTAALAGGAWAAETAPAEVRFDGSAVPQRLTDAPGDPARGRAVFIDRKLGNCLACHANSDMADEPFHGEIGPPLDGVADRWSEAELRGILVNSKKAFEGTIMPAFYKDSGFNRPLRKFAGKPILTAQQVEDVVAYLLTLKEE